MVKLYCSIFICSCLIVSCSTNRKLQIIDPVDTKIICNTVFGDTSSLNIVLYDSNAKEELNGALIGTMTFDTIIKDTTNQLIIKNFEPTWLRLKNSVSDEIVFNQYIDFKMKDDDYATYNLYIVRLLPIIMCMKCWIVYVDQYYQPAGIQLSMMFSFKVIPSNIR